MNVQEYTKRINQYSNDRTPLNVTAVYEALKDRFFLTLTSAYCLENGKTDYDEDYIMVCGSSSAGSFQLYDNGLNGVFDIDKVDGSYSHWHPADTKEAIEHVIAFMEPTIHNMNLNPEPFAMIKAGFKTIELRLWDEKRQKIQIGDTIVFQNTETGELLSATVLKLHIFKSFAELYQSLPLLQCGYTPEDVKNAEPGDMNQYYPPEIQQKYGVVGIELDL